MLTVPVTGRMTAWIETARAGGSSAFWHTNDPSWSRGGVDAVPAAGLEPIAATARAAATATKDPTILMREYQQPVPRKVPDTPALPVASL
jgi:hypothetical protein